jgi:hypothetical protein
MTRLKENGTIEAWTDVDGVALIIHNNYVTVPLDEEEEEHLLRVIEAHLAERQQPNLDGEARAVPAANNGWHFYHLDCSAHFRTSVHALVVCPHELPAKTPCALCGGSIRKAALIEE